MLYKNLFQEILINPITQGADTLKIISGYATASMASRHLEDLVNKNKDVQVKLLVGMTPKDGIAISNHEGFKSILESEKFGRNFSCQYIYQNTPVHSKLFLWEKASKFHKAFIGSANYSHTAFSKRQRELMQPSNNEELLRYFDTIEKDSIDIRHPEIEEYVRIMSDSNYFGTTQIENEKEGLEIIEPFKSNKSVKVSLLSKKLDYEVQNIAGLNWGQRPSRANKNEAYIQLPPFVYKSDFFPPKPNQFIVRTDDNKTLICVRTSKDEVGQQLQTPLNNAHLGEYFRNRMGHPSEKPIWRAELENYGRTDVDFYKIDDETYYMDFSV
ncbi:restriction endonuclease PLD domain-containing protein [Rasiella sp. SM2506]|uniref:restriction endonuclease PLD domain-containing protein n=1 Tax=Rasiella sp. SM2506 TaxID=3423914 RepID=UPI003D79CF7E